MSGRTAIHNKCEPKQDGESSNTLRYFVYIESHAANNTSWWAHVIKLSWIVCCAGGWVTMENECDIDIHRNETHAHILSHSTAFAWMMTVAAMCCAGTCVVYAYCVRATTASLTYSGECDWNLSILRCSKSCSSSLSSWQENWLYISPSGRENFTQFGWNAKRPMSIRYSGII